MWPWVLALMLFCLTIGFGLIVNHLRQKIIVSGQPTPAEARIHTQAENDRKTQNDRSQKLILVVQGMTKDEILQRLNAPHYDDPK